MGENANEKKAATAESTEATAEKKEKKGKKGADATDMDLTPHAHLAREKKKSRWTLEACQKAASRFATRDAWAAGAPSSFKAAVSRGWEAECLKVMKKGEGKAAPTAAPTRSKSPTRAA